MASDGRHALIGYAGRVWRVSATGKVAVAGIDPDAAASGQASDLALFEPIALTVSEAGEFWLSDLRRGTIMWIDPTERVHEVPIQGTALKDSLRDAWRFPLLRPAPDGDVYFLGTLAAGLGIHRVGKDGTATLLYAPPPNTAITDFTPMPDGSMLILLDQRDTGDALVRRRADGTVEPVFTAQTTSTDYPMAGGKVYTHVKSDPVLHECNIMPGAGGEVWFYGQGRLARWRPSDGYTVVRKGDHYLQPDNGSGDGGRAGCVLGPDGALYFTPGDMGNGSLSQVRRFDPVTGVESLVAGRGGLAFAGEGVDERLTDPHSPVFAPSGDLLFLDMAARQIRRIPKDKLLGVPIAPDDEE